MIEPGSVNGHLVRIKEELRKAEAKHPEFCDAMIDPSLDMTWNEIESCIKLRNERNPITADNILGEEVAEAMNSYQKGDKAHCLHELAQCGAVIIRMMEFVKKEMEDEKQ